MYEHHLKVVSFKRGAPLPPRPLTPPSPPSPPKKTELRNTHPPTRPSTLRLQRYKVCEHHLKVDSIERDGMRVRFCQQVRGREGVGVCTEVPSRRAQRHWTCVYLGRGGLARVELAGRVLYGDAGKSVGGDAHCGAGAGKRSGGHDVQA